MIPYQQTLCPILSVASIRPEEKILIAGHGQTPPAKEMEMIRCQGPACAFFLTTGGEDGKPTGGRCCIPLIPMSIQQAISLANPSTSTEETPKA